MLSFISYWQKYSCILWFFGNWIYFTFETEYIPQDVFKKIRDKSITHNIFGILDNESIMCEFYCAAFTEYILAGKKLSDHTNLFSLNDYKKKDKIIINMVEEASLEFRLRKIDETRNYVLA